MIVHTAAHRGGSTVLQLLGAFETDRQAETARETMNGHSHPQCSEDDHMMN